MAETKPKNLSIPVDLHADLARFPNENWSEIACLAFRIRVKELEAMTATEPNAKAIARLQALKLQREAEIVQGARDAGIKFALESADIVELERLEAWTKEPGLLESASSLASILESNRWDVRDRARTLRDDYGNDADRAEWMQSFIDGAVEKFQELKKYL